MPRPVDEGQPYRLLVWVLLASIAINVGQAFGNATLVAAVAEMANRVEVKPFFITADLATNRVFRVTNAETDMPTYDRVALTLARRYVMLRESLDLQTEASRWVEASWLASEKVSEDFKSLVDKEGSYYKTMRQRGRTREIRIVASPEAGRVGRQRTYLIEFEQIDKEKGQEINKRSWIATVVMDTQKGSVRFEDALLNPYGNVVTFYDVAPKNTKE
ncbi:VirB8 protein [Azospirillum oryzae]|uniref:VirB8 protein n=1 Tax=Azospirillum oryzae TaxID=286727 RepID=A0A1X7ES99_9PROT|nr:type IV secretion system protein [Azospirillum oryzae]SMF39232.1 VirB8 protein [Azospirillum oryzae]